MDDGWLASQCAKVTAALRQQLPVEQVQRLELRDMQEQLVGCSVVLAGAEGHAGAAERLVHPGATGWPVS